MAQKWKSMKSAPKDGTPILAWANGDMATVKWYSSSTTIGTGWWELVQAGSYCDDDGEWEPELWQHLPKEPQPNKKKDKQGYTKLPMSRHGEI